MENLFDVCGGTVLFVIFAVIIEGRVKINLSGLLVSWVLKWVVVSYYCLGSRCCRGVSLHVPFNEFPMDKVGFHNVVTNHDHKFGVINMSAVQS